MITYRTTDNSEKFICLFFSLSFSVIYKPRAIAFFPATMNIIENLHSVLMFLSKSFSVFNKHYFVLLPILFLLIHLIIVFGGSTIKKSIQATEKNHKNWIYGECYDSIFQSEKSIVTDFHE